MFEFLRSHKVYNVRHTDGTWSQTTARSESEAIQKTSKAVDKVEFVRYVGDPASDHERLNRR